MAECMKKIKQRKINTFDMFMSYLNTFYHFNVTNEFGNYSLLLLFPDVNYATLQAATILVAMASGKNFWRPKFWRKSPIGDQQINRESYLKNYQ